MNRGTLIEAVWIVALTSAEIYNRDLALSRHATRGGGMSGSIAELMLCDTTSSRFSTLEYYWCWREGALSRITSILHQVLYVYYIGSISELPYDVVSLPDHQDTLVWS